MVRTRALRFLLILSLIALLIPLSIAQAQSPGGSGTAIVRDGSVYVSHMINGETLRDSRTAHSSALSISMSGVPAPAANMAYEGWLVSDDGTRKESTGILEVSEDGNVNHSFSLQGDNGEPTGENLIGSFNTFLVTVEPLPDTDPGPSANIKYKDMVSAGVIEQIRLLTHAAGDGEGYAVALRNQLNLAVASARAAQAGARTGNLTDARADATCVLEFINGDAAEGSTCGGDGIGIIAHASSVATHAGNAQMAGPDNEALQASGTAAIEAANASRDQASQAASSAEAAIASTNSPEAALILNNVEHLLGATGGALSSAETAYRNAQDMASYRNVSFPSVGEPVIPQLARYGLISSIALLLLGAAAVFASRRRATANAA